MSVAPGWYKDPAEPTSQRWWDGEGWVGDPLPADVTPPDGPPPTRPGRLREPPFPMVLGPPGAVDAPPPPAGPVPPSEPTPPAAGAEVPPGWPVGHTRLPPGAQLRLGPTPPARPHGHPLASLGERAVARLIDIAVVLGLNLLVNSFFVYLFWKEISPTVSEIWRRSMAGEDMSDLPAAGDQAGTLQLVIVVLAAALWFAYEVPAVANTGQTLGKRLLRIRVVRMEQAGPVGFGRSFRRWNTMGLPTLLWWCLGLGFLMQLVDFVYALYDRPLQQALHDKSARTVVVSVANRREEPPDEQADPS